MGAALQAAGNAAGAPRPKAPGALGPAPGRRVAEALGAVGAGLLVAAIVASQAWGVLAGVVGALAIALAFVRPFDGALLVLAYGFVLNFFTRMVTAPIGLGVDVLLLVLATRLVIDLGRFKDWQRLRNPVIWPIALTAAYAVLEIANPIAPGLQFGVFGIRVMAGYAVLHVVAAYYYDGPRHLARLTGLFLGFGAFAALYGIRQAGWNFTDAEYRWFMNGGIETHFVEGHLRIWSIFADAGTCSFAFVAAIFMAGTAVACRPGVGWRAWGAAAALVGLLTYALLITYTRAGYMALAAALATAPFWTRSGKGMVAVAVAAVLAHGALQVAAAGGNYAAQRVLSSADSEDGSAAIRRDYIERSIPVILTSPMGIGSGTTGRRGSELAGRANQEGQSKGGGAIGVGTPTDNSYFKVALETGLPGLALFLWVHAALVATLARAIARWPAGPERAFALGFALTFVAYLVGAFGQNLFDNPPNNLFFWLGSGVAARLAPGPVAGTDHAAGHEGFKT